MAILLTDIPAAVADYLHNQVTVLVSDVVPDNKKLSPGERGTCKVTVINAADGLRLINLRVHLEIVAHKGGDPDPQDDPDADTTAKKVALLVAPLDGGTQCNDNDKDNPQDVAHGATSPTGELVIKYTDERSTLEADGLSFVQPVQLVCTEHGDVKVRAHVHADVDLSALFPNSRGKNGSGTLVVDF